MCSWSPSGTTCSQPASCRRSSSSEPVAPRFFDSDVEIDTVPAVRSEVTWPTIPAMVRDTARRDPGREAVVEGERRVTYGELLARVEEVARALLASGLAPGERVAVWAPNSIEWIVAALGITMSG